MGESTMLDNEVIMRNTVGHFASAPTVFVCFATKSNMWPSSDANCILA